MESVFTTNIYNFAVRTFTDKDFLLAITESDLEILVNAFNNGEERVMINGESVFIKDPTLFKIYLINNNRFGTDAPSVQKELKKYIKVTARDFEDILDIIEEFGVNVTNKFISEKYGALKDTLQNEFDFIQPVIEKAKKFSKDIKHHHFPTINQFVNKLNENIKAYDDEKTFIYLLELQKGIIEEIRLHKLTCNKNPCPTEAKMIEFLGYVNQEQKKIKSGSTNYSDSSKNFSVEEIINLNQKIDDIRDYLNTLHIGQQVIFEEIEDLKNLTSILNKKNWKEVVKGKLFDISVSKAIENETIKFIYKSLTEESLNLLN